MKDDMKRGFVIGLVAGMVLCTMAAAAGIAAAAFVREGGWDRSGWGGPYRG
jgi:hypothetical protein